MMFSESLEHPFLSKSSLKDCFRGTFQPEKWVNNPRKSQNRFIPWDRCDFQVPKCSYYGSNNVGTSKTTTLWFWFHFWDPRFRWTNDFNAFIQIIRNLLTLKSILCIRELSYASESAINRFFSSFYIRADPTTFFWAHSEILDGGSQNLTNCKESTPQLRLAKPIIAKTLWPP